jgi:hypothetical protein
MKILGGLARHRLFLVSTRKKAGDIAHGGTDERFRCSGRQKSLARNHTETGFDLIFPRVEQNFKKSTPAIPGLGSG